MPPSVTYLTFKIILLSVRSSAKSILKSDVTASTMKMWTHVGTDSFILNLENR